MDRPNSAIPSKARSTHSPDNQSSPASMADPIPRRAAPGSSISLSPIDLSSALWLCEPTAARSWYMNRGKRGRELVCFFLFDAGTPLLPAMTESTSSASRGAQRNRSFRLKKDEFFSRAARGRTGKACDNSFRLFMWLRARGFLRGTIASRNR